MAKKPSQKKVETFTHEEATRRNIPTAEYQSLIEDDPKTVRYPRNTDLDPQIVWRGKDEQDWSDLPVTVDVFMSIFHTDTLIEVNETYARKNMALRPI